MTGLIILIPLAILMGLGGLVAFFWAVRSGQFDDPAGASYRILQEDDVPLHKALEDVRE